MSSEVLEKIKRFTVFADVPPKRLEQMSQETFILEHDRHSFVWNEGDTSRYLFLIVSGRIKVIKHSETGKDVIIEIFGPLDAIGEMSLLVGGTYTTTAVCLSQTELLCVPKQQILDLLSTVPGMALRSLRGMARRQRMAIQKIKELAAGGVEYRMAHLLLKLADRLGEETGDADIKIPLVFVSTGYR